MAIPAVGAFVPTTPAGFVSLAAPAVASAEKVAGAARDFEALLVGELLKQMRESLGPDGGFFGKDGGDVMGGLFDFFMGNHLAASGGIGLADPLQRQLQTDRLR